MALDEFIEWYREAPRPGFTKATVSAWRVSLEARGLGSSSIIIRMSAIRKLAVEAADNGLLAPELAAGITRVKSVKSTGIRVGNWLSLRQAQTLLRAPDIATVRYGDMIGGPRVGLISENTAALTFSPAVCYPNCVREIPGSARFGPECGTRQCVSQPQ
jgi:hypothetical protein